MTIPFGIRYETEPEKLAWLEQIATDVVETVKGCKLLRCTLVNFGASSLDYQLVLELKSIDPDRLARDRSAVMLALIERFADEKIGFAYPVQVAYTAAPDGSLVMPYPEE
jgi:small-conductance mechanosensitive channel